MNQSIFPQNYLEAMGIMLWHERVAVSARHAMEYHQPHSEKPVVATVSDEKSPIERNAKPSVDHRPPPSDDQPAIPDWFDEAPPPFDEMPPEILLDEFDLQDSQPKPKAIGSLGWEGLASRIAECRICPLHETRSQTVFGSGLHEARLLIIGDAPDTDEERLAEPIVGKPGELLTAMLAAIGLERSEVFVTNMLKCRPPGNREPHIAEMQKCRPYLLRQIELISPDLILAVGRFAAQHLLDSDESVAKLRNHEFRFGPEQIPLIVSYHPGYLLRSPEQKAKVWQDLQRVAALLNPA